MHDLRQGTQTQRKVKQENHAVARRPRDAAIIIKFLQSVYLHITTVAIGTVR